MPDHIYLASPYTSSDPAIRQARFEAVTQVAGALMRQQKIVFSPITMGHPISEVCTDIPSDFGYWESTCLSYLHGWATRLIVLKLDGWQESRGVKAEIEAAKRLGLPIDFLESNHG